MGKRILGLVITLCLLTSLFVGCGNSDGEEQQANTEETKTVENASTEVKTSDEESAEIILEAPMLTEKVNAGELPALEERLPVNEDVMVEQVVEEIGQHGGDWNMTWTGIDDKWLAGKMTEEALFRFNEDGSGIEPNVAKGYEVNEDATEYIIYLREGMKWSDGVPFTADDVLFYWEHMLLKESFGKKLYNCYYSVDPETGEKAVAEVEKIDDYTVKITHKYPSPLFLERVAIDNKWFFAPAHFYEGILPEFLGEEKALEVAKEWGYTDLKGFGKWTGYYYWIWEQRPTLRAWVATNDPNGEQFVMERNPYYWKTDIEGKQLPYIDRLVFKRVEDSSHKLLEAMSGSIDAQFMDSISDFTVLKENESKGDYRVYLWDQASWGSTGLQLNQTVEDPNLRELFQDIRFREALSVSVDRVEVSEIVTNGLTDPQQASVPKGLANYQEGWADQWTEYDVDRANALLDEIGLTWDSNKEFRTFADGSELTLVIYDNGENSANEKLTELLKKYYETIGIRTNVKLIDKALYQELKYDNQLPATVGAADVVNVAYRPDVILPLRVLTPWYGHYGLYNATNGEEGIKPEGDVALLLEYWDNVVSSTKSEDIQKWCDEIIKLHQKNQWILGFTGPSPKILVVQNSMHNVPDEQIFADEFRDLGHAKPAQFFFK